MSRGVADELQIKNRDAQIIAMVAAGVKVHEIADALGVNRKTVQRALNRERDTVTSIDKKLAEVQRQLKNQMPIRERVEGLVRVARESEMDFARLHSIKYLNELDGIHPQLEREKLKRDREQPQTQPMFMLPVGSQVNVTINQTIPADSVSAAVSREVIDVKASNADE